MAIRSYKYIDPYQWVLILFMPVVTAAYFARSVAQSDDAMMFANDLVYSDGTILPAIFLLSTCLTLKVNINKIFKSLIYIAAIAHLVLVWFGSVNGLYYKNLSFVRGPYGSYLNYEAGPLKFLHYVYIVPIIIAIIVLIIKAFRHPEKTAPKITWSYLFLAGGASVFYMIDIISDSHYEILPLFYAISTWTMCFYYNQNFVHNIDNIVATVHETGAVRGFIAFDLQKKFLCANEMARSILPDLNKMDLDKAIGHEFSFISDFFSDLINRLETGVKDPNFLDIDSKSYKCQASYFYTRKKSATKGFLIELSDDTVNRKYLEFVNNYNETLSQAIKNQTSNIRNIQAKVVLGLADMIENRDQSTGSHVKRTSDIIQILVGVMNENDIGSLDRLYSEDIIRAAPMHDLGKIAIDNSILCKPGKLTDEEYMIMKTHSVKSGEIVRAILNGVEENHFVTVAYNVARYHHERWDGKGYPEGLSGTNIPLEARIMAIADVYDALVSKRCYKEPMSFKQAYTVMMANMGTQFDPGLETVFVLSCPQFETYYKSIG